MAEVIGPCRTLPGAGHHLPDGTMCDLHPDRPAVARVQGETDSFGAELNDMCQGCLDAHKAYRNSPEARTGRCDWCKNPATDLRPRRDFEEGMSGRLYDVCGACVKKENERLKAEAEEHDQQNAFDDYDDYDDRRDDE